MQFETQFPEGFPEVGDLIRFTCTAETVHSGCVTAEEITGKKTASTVEVLVVGREYDAATDLHYLTTSETTYHSISNLDGWESQGWLVAEIMGVEGADQNLCRLERHRTKIHELTVVRKHR